MRPLHAAVVLVGLCVADDKPTAPMMVRPENDSRLAKLWDAHLQKIGILTYFLNEGGGYTFIEAEHIEFYSLPNVPTTSSIKDQVIVLVNVNGKVTRRHVPQLRTIKTVGTSKMPFGGQTVYRLVVKEADDSSVFRREDIPIAKWTRDTPDGKFRLSILAEDNETRLKLKSIVPVLERAEHVR
jgi:hypothetical protein